MSRTKHHRHQNRQHCGEDFWGGRGDLIAPGTGPYAKLLTHRKERCASKRLTRKELSLGERE
jgi:hypothetical protein